MADDLSEIVISPNDKRHYRRVELPNELQALLISDPETDKAAASMSVNVGSWSDPEGLEGLAHFLEHMLFFSSEKYPLEDSYKKYITEHGGESNAYTSDEFTNYHFDINHNFFEGGLDRFAQFFICPLMSADAITREIKAVDSEHSNNLTSDVHRMHQIKCSISSKDHPYHRFGTGNLETLHARPLAKGIDTREELLKFYQTYYSSNLMCLVIYGRESLDELQHLVEEKFSAVKNTHKKSPRFLEEPCHKEHLQIIVRGVPLREGHSIELLWQVPTDIQNYKVRPCRYLAHIVGHEAEGSLFALLKSLGWANSLVACAVDISKEFSFFTVSIELTDIGQDHVCEIVSLVSQFIRIVVERGVSEWSYEEQRLMHETEFNYQEKGEPLDYVTALSMRLHVYPPVEWIRGGIFQQFDKDIIVSVLERLVPENVRMFWWSKQFQGKTTEIEPWYGTAYSVEKIDDVQMKEWISTTPDIGLRIPLPNIFIPSDFTLQSFESKVKHPVLLRKTAMSRLWYKPDSTFLTPKTYFRLEFNCPESSHSPESHAMSCIFIRLLLDSLNEYAYYAEIAGLDYNIWRTSFGFQIYIGGYNHKLRTLAEKIVERLVSFKVKEDRFTVIKEKMKKAYINTKYDQPHQQANHYLSLMLYEKCWDTFDILEVLEELDSGSLESFIPRFLSRVFFESYIGGNFTLKEAENFASFIEYCFQEGPIMKTKAIFSSQHAVYRTLRLEQGTNLYFQAPTRNVKDENSAVQVYFQIGQVNVRTSVLRKIFEHTASQEFFRVIRTVEQLGYLVWLYSVNDRDVLGVNITIQSKLKDPAYLDDRVEAFLEWFEIYLQKMTHEEFQKHVEVLKQCLLQKHKNIWEESNFYWSQIEDETLKFDWPEIQVAELENLQKQDLLWFFEEFIKKKSAKRKKISVQVCASTHFAKEAEMRGSLTSQINGISIKTEVACEMMPKPQRIYNIYNFKRSQSFYGSPNRGL